MTDRFDLSDLAPGYDLTSLEKQSDRGALDIGFDLSKLASGLDFSELAAESERFLQGAGSDLSALASGVSVAQRALAATSREGTLAAQALSEAFESAGRDIAASLEGAARSGELSFSALAEQIAQSFAQIALDQLVLQPISGLLDGAAGQLGALLGGVLGKRAEGGPVLAGERYLVGERGPEVFTPGQSGAISPMATAPISITINAQGGTLDSVRRSESQIAAAVARAVQRGGRQL